MIVYGLTIFLSALLLFQAELIIGKELLPWFGGIPSVWTTCLLFFQLVLLAGYTYAHFVVKRFSTRRQVLVHLAVLGIAVAVLAIQWALWPSPITPDAGWKPAGGDEPTIRLLALLAVSVGIPFFVLSTTGPLLQGWFASVYPTNSPYRLYALSNVGSLLGLLLYPILVEPLLPIRGQAIVWSLTYLLFALGVIMSANRLRSVASVRLKSQVENDRTPTQSTPHPMDVLLWTGLAAAASALLLSTTNHMCQDVATIPLLWILPLSLYLVTFVLCFEFEILYRRWLFPPLFGAALVWALSILFSDLTFSLLLQIAADAAVLFTGCMVCHGELSRAKPAKEHLTIFYLAIASGGALGAIAVAIVAPNLFDGFWEFQLSIFITGTLFLLAVLRDRTSFFYKKSFLAGSTFGLVLVILQWFLFKQALEQTSETRFMKRNFYGVLRIEEDAGAHSLKLRHGRITHGFQYLDSIKARFPTTYFSKGSGVGLAIENHPRRKEGLRIGVVGLGVGTIATYAHQKDTVRFYEINPAVYELSRGPKPFFTYLKNCEGTAEVVLGDARLTLEEELRRGKNQGFDILAIDAFLSDAIPVHLLTREAFEVYLRHMRSPESVIAIHISNRHLNLKPVVRGLADNAGLASSVISAAEDDEGGWLSEWVLISRSESVLRLKPLADATTPWDSTGTKKTSRWTDDYSDIISLLK